MIGAPGQPLPLESTTRIAGWVAAGTILELLDITKDTPLEVKTDGEALIIRPAKLSKKERIRESTKRMMSDEPLFLDAEDVLEIHATQLDVYGGPAGLRDRGLLESADASR